MVLWWNIQDSKKKLPKVSSVPIIAAAYSTSPHHNIPVVEILENGKTVGTNAGGTCGENG